MAHSQESAGYRAEDEDGWDDEEWEEEEPVSEQRQRVESAMELAEKDASRGVPVLVGMLTDWDLDEDGTHELRAEVLGHLMHMGRSAAGAATWVVGEAGTAYELHVVLQYASCPPYREPPVMTPQERRRWNGEVMEHIVAAKGLAEQVRWAAISEYLDLTGYPGYRALATLAPDIDVLAAVSGGADAPEHLLHTLSTYVAQDSGRPLALRVDIVERLWDDSPLGAGGALAGVLRDCSVSGTALRTLLHTLARCEEETLEELVEHLRQDEYERTSRRFLAATLDSLDAAHRLHRLSRIGEHLHMWVRETVQAEWGGADSHDVCLDSEDIGILTDLAARYHELRDDVADPSSSHLVVKDQLALDFNTEVFPPRWHTLTLGRAPGIALWVESDVRAVVCVRPTSVPGTRSWRFGVEDTGRGEVITFRGRLVDTGDGRCAVDFPADLMERPEWAHLLLQGVKALSEQEAA
ncbi:MULTISPECIES: hypothetical protein [Streptomyces]|uniref:hypothetical protein n=2 Tax=Streptomyces TaxID=1883 RepID=UPI00287FD17B|nr:hypothetical protein [Streptomyces sp. CGMCC 4.1456]WNF66530.1 hypothetical protein RJD14_29895 [Streptomyces sp. CGMCC 4.1456]